MLLVMSWWILAMVSGLLWAPRYTIGCITVTLVTFLATQAATLVTWAGWVQLTALGLTPWLLAAQRTRNEQQLRRLQAQEAEQMVRMAEAARTLLSLQTSTQQMEAQIADITELYHVTKKTSGTLHLAELFAASLDIVPRLLSAKGLRLIDLSNDAPHILRAMPATEGQLIVSEARHPLDLEEAIMHRLSSMAHAATATAADLACAFPEGTSRVAWAPLWRKQRPVGVLVADELPETQLKTLTIVANQLSLQLSRIHLYQRVEALAVTDALTGVCVRGHFMERAREELARSRRHHLACTLLMTDLDFFKQKNDTYGHLVGDVVLRDVARLLQRNLRDIDLLARYGGEEFILLLIDTQVEQGFTIAQRLKQLVEVHPIRAYDELLSQTISIGVAGFPEDAKTLEEFIERADQALYAAKRAGRNQVLRWTASMQT